MTWEDIVRKLTSRKFWIALVGFITPLMIAFGHSEATVTQAASIIMAGGTLIAYIIGEGLVDSARAADQEEDGQIISIINAEKDEE